MKPQRSQADSYFGGKGLCFRHLINQIPPHDHLIVPFAGHCAIVRNLQLPARVLINDLDDSVIRYWRSYFQVWKTTSQIHIRQECGLALLESLRRSPLPGKVFIYLDPPYVLSTRRSWARYNHELTDDEHATLLSIAAELPYPVMISGYSSQLYNQALRKWRHFCFPSMTRSGLATEHCWCNFPQPQRLQDYSFLGENKRERFKLDRRRRNLISKLRRLPALERNALLAAVVSEFGDTVPKPSPNEERSSHAVD